MSTAKPSLLRAVQFCFLRTPTTTTECATTTKRLVGSKRTHNFASCNKRPRVCSIDVPLRVHGGKWSQRTTVISHL